MIHPQLTRHRCSIFFTCLFLLVIFQTNAVSQEKRHILVLHSYNEGLEWTDSEDEGIMSVLQPRLNEIEVHTEYLDAKRVAGDGNFSELYQFLEKKYASTRFESIICSDDDAFNFILRNRHSIFSGVPVVFCGVNYRMSEKWILNATGAFALNANGNVAESVNVIRIGESMLVQVGVYADQSRGSFGANFSVEPRFLAGKAGRVGGVPIPPAGAYGVE